MLPVCYSFSFSFASPIKALLPWPIIWRRENTHPAGTSIILGHASEAIAGLGSGIECCPICYTSRLIGLHIERGCRSHRHNRGENPRENSSCSQPGLCIGRYSHSSHPDKQRSPCNWRSTDPADRPVPHGIPDHSHCLPPVEAGLRRID